MKSSDSIANVSNITSPIIQNLNQLNESVWLQIGSIWESINDTDKAFMSYENVLRHNPFNIQALTQAATICRLKELYPQVCYPKIRFFFFFFFFI